MDLDLFFMSFCGEVLVGHWTEKQREIIEIQPEKLEYYTIILITSVVFWSMADKCVRGFQTAAQL